MLPANKLLKPLPHFRMPAIEMAGRVWGGGKIGENHSLCTPVQSTDITAQRPALSQVDRDEKENADGRRHHD